MRVADDDSESTGLIDAAVDVDWACGAGAIGWKLIPVWLDKVGDFFDPPNTKDTLGPVEVTGTVKGADSMTFGPVEAGVTDGARFDSPTCVLSLVVVVVVVVVLVGGAGSVGLENSAALTVGGSNDIAVSF